MPTPDATPDVPPRHPLTAYTTLRHLEGARAMVVTDAVNPGHVIANIGATYVGVQLIGEPATVRRLLDDLSAQLDAIEAGQ